MPLNLNTLIGAKPFVPNATPVWGHGSASTDGCRARACGSKLITVCFLMAIVIHARASKGRDQIRQRRGTYYISCDVDRITNLEHP